jgi:hypothetical protein
MYLIFNNEIKICSYRNCARAQRITNRSIKAQSSLLGNDLLSHEIWSDRGISEYPNISCDRQIVAL